jgi:hypothetical protein
MHEAGAESVNKSDESQHNSSETNIPQGPALDRSVDGLIPEAGERIVLNKFSVQPAQKIQTQGFNILISEFRLWSQAPETDVLEPRVPEDAFGTGRNRSSGARSSGGFFNSRSDALTFIGILAMVLEGSEITEDLIENYANGILIGCRGGVLHACEKFRSDIAPGPDNLVAGCQ